MTLKTNHLFILGLVCGCLTERPEAQAPLDLTRRLGPEEVLAGVVHDESALFGGISAEGEVGDVKIYNNRARFIIQGVRDSGYYIPYGGNILDADIVRGFGQPGQDIIDDAAIMVGFGSLFKAESVTVLNDGTDGNAAIVRATGVGAPLELVGGAVENLSFAQSRVVDIQTDYILEPDSPLLRIDTEARWRDSDTTIEVSDIFFVAFDVVEDVHPGLGPDGTRPDNYEWAGLVGQRNEVAMAIMQGSEPFESNTALDLISEIGPIVLASGPSQPATDGAVITATRHLGVAPDLATLTDAWLATQDVPTQTIGGSVTASGYTVAGARVHVLDEDMRVVTQAITGGNGTWQADVPATTQAQVVATGRGTGVHYDLPVGAGWFSPYSASSVRLGSLAALNGGAQPIHHADGYGISALRPALANTPLSLTRPGTLSVSVTDGGPAVVRVDFTEPDPPTEHAWLAHERPSGAAAWLYIKDGYGEIPVEPGEYTVVVHRGARYDPVIRSVAITGGDTTELVAELEPIGMPAGIWSADPHAHASPSPDGKLPMEGRLLTHAAHGIDIHFGTDHDHIADYRVLLGPLGLSGVLASIVSSEVSPPLRGHHNAYPLQEARDLPSNGGLAWWSDWKDWNGTAGFFEQIRRLPSDGAVIVQANHPTGTGGLLGSAGYDPAQGIIAHPEMWSPNFDAIEILNDGSHSNYVLHYLDLVNRGLRPVPTGVSDSHGHRGGVGQNMTWVPIDVEHMGELEPDHIRTAWAAGGTVASTGPIIEARVDGDWAPGQTLVGETTLDVTVWAPDWMDIARVHLRENGTVIETVEATQNAPMRLNTTLELNPSADAAYVVEVEGDLDMSPVYPGGYPWAMTAAIWVDVDGDGWTPPLPSLRLE